MAEGNFDQALVAVLKHEGGYVDHRSDPGGATNLGITIGTLSNWLGRKATKTEVRALTVAKVNPIYRKNYWDKVRGDELPSGVDYAVFDYAVNSGPSRAIKHLQEILGVDADGIIGPDTLAAIRRSNPRDIIEDLSKRRMRFLEGLSTFATFGRGWTSRVTGVRAAALALVDHVAIPPDMPTPAPKPAPVPPHPVPDPMPEPSGITGTIVALILAALAVAFFVFIL